MTQEQTDKLLAELAGELSSNEKRVLLNLYDELYKGSLWLSRWLGIEKEEVLSILRSMKEKDLLSLDVAWGEEGRLGGKGYFLTKLGYDLKEIVMSSMPEDELKEMLKIEYH